MKQFDGNDTTGTIDTNDVEDIDDELYKETEDYWKRGWLGMHYQPFLDATRIIDESDLNEEEKKHEKDAGARKDALGDGFVNFPPCLAVQKWTNFGPVYILEILV